MLADILKKSVILQEIEQPILLLYRKSNLTLEKTMNENEFQFVLDCDVESLVSFLQEDYHLTLSDAFEKVYSSKTFEKLKNPQTGLYLQSPAYIYSFLQEELA